MQDLNFKNCFMYCWYKKDWTSHIILSLNKRQKYVVIWLNSCRWTMQNKILTERNSCQLYFFRHKSLNCEIINLYSNLHYRVQVMNFKKIPLKKLKITAGRKYGLLIRGKGTDGRIYITVKQFQWRIQCNENLSDANLIYLYCCLSWAGIFIKSIIDWINAIVVSFIKVIYP